MSHFTLLLVSSILFGVVPASLANSRIIGGNDAVSKQFPHQISLRRDHSHSCGGSIISKRYVLTAAHCVVKRGTLPYPAEVFTIRAGSINRIAGGIIIRVKSILVHPGYDEINDLALIELSEDLIFSDTIQAIEMFDSKLPANSDIIISGWGLTMHAGAGLPIYLQYNNVTSLSKVSCAKQSGYYTNGLICLNHPEGVGACHGDSGGPATYNGKLVGVASFVLVRCGSSYPDGYGNVTYNIEWIRNNMT